MKDKNKDNSPIILKKPQASSPIEHALFFLDE